MQHRPLQTLQENDMLIRLTHVTKSVKAGLKADKNTQMSTALYSLLLI